MMKMSKWATISIISALAVGAIVLGVFYFQESGKLKTAESEIVTLEGDVSTLKGNVFTLETDLTAAETEVARLDGELAAAQATVSVLEAELAAAGAIVSTLQTDLAAAQAQVSTLEADLAAAQAQVSTLSEELRTIRSPRHFKTITELTDWLAQDDTDTAYLGKSFDEMAFILQVRALRDGYLLPAFAATGGFGFNVAAIGNVLYSIDPVDDDTGWAMNIDPLLLYPLPLE
jgi:predicted  nucleic acid-binding Zn-ribbon protein